MNNLVNGSGCHSTPWNKGKLVGQKAPLRVSEIWAIRVRLEIFGRVRDLALFNLFWPDVALRSAPKELTYFTCSANCAL